jgi:arsenate reductase
MSQPGRTKRVLFLCNGNSCRSQMAEGLINHDIAGQWQAESAGTEAAGYLHPGAIAAMAELGINISGQRSRSVDAFRSSALDSLAFDVVITVCADAEESCPTWLGGGARLHIGFEVPARATGHDAAILATFRTVRDQMRERLAAALHTLTCVH